jgi:hypothetical protein
MPLDGLPDAYAGHGLARSKVTLEAPIRPWICLLTPITVTGIRFGDRYRCPRGAV